MSPAIPHHADFQFVQQCLEGDETAVRTLLRDFRTPTISVLVARGARPGEAEDVVENLWSECLARDDGRPGRLENYNGECKLQTWLNTVAYNAWLTKRRNKQRQEEILEGPDGPGPESGAAGTPAGRNQPGASDAPLIALLREAIEAGFRSCSPEHFVMLQLLHADRLRLRELARMFGCGEPWMSKTIHRAEKEMRAAILAYVKERDPQAELQWEDFVELCSAAAPACFGLE